MGDSILVAIWHRITGRPVRRVELDETELAQEVDLQVRRLLNRDADSFSRDLKDGKLDRRDWRVEYLAGLVE